MAFEDLESIQARFLSFRLHLSNYVILHDTSSVRHNMFRGVSP